MSEVTVVIGAGLIGQAIARRISSGKHVILADLKEANAEAAAKTLKDAGFDVSTASVDVANRASVEALVKAATSTGDTTGVIHAAGVSPSQAPPETILKVDLYGTALVLEEFGNVIAKGGSGVVIASMSGHRLGPLTTEQSAQLATTPVEELLALPFLQLDQVKNSLHAYQLSKRCNSLRVMAEAVRWGKGGARVNTISPGIIITPHPTIQNHDAHLIAGGRTMEQYDAVVVGSGEAGKYLAWHLAGLGQKVIVVERALVGGACPNVACLPSKNIIHSASVVHAVRHGATFGAETSGLVVNPLTIRKRKRGMVRRLIELHHTKFQNSGVELLMGEAAFIAPLTLEVACNDDGTRTLRSTRIFLNTGSRALVPAIPGLREAKPLTHVEALEHWERSQST